MSEQQPTHRIVLGPEASSLIKGVEGNRQAALDAAILELKERAGSDGGTAGTEKAPALDLQSLAERMGAIEARMDAFIESLDRLRLVALAELRTTRLYIGTMLEARDEEDVQQILEIGRQTQDRVYDELRVLTKEDASQLARDEERVVHMMREDMIRGAPDEKQKESGDRERT